MKVKRESRVHTEVNWLATVTFDQEEFDQLVDVLTQIAELGHETNDLSLRAYDLVQTLTVGAPDPDGPKRPITELKRKAAQNGR